MSFAWIHPGAVLCSVRGSVHPCGWPEPAQLPSSARDQSWHLSCWRWSHWWGGEGLQDDHNAPHVWSHVGTARQNVGLCTRESGRCFRYLNLLWLSRRINARNTLCKYQGNNLMYPWQRNHLKESKEPANENRVLAMPEHTCRILDFSAMDQIHFVSLRKYVTPQLFHSKHQLLCSNVMY